jgi:transcriptional regulator with XRE-family HTH domain
MNNIKKARETAKFSQKEVALTLKVSPPTVSEWESGKKNPTVENLKKLSELFSCSIDYLLGKTDIFNIYEEENELITIAAHHEGEWTEEELEDIEKFKDYIKSKRKA